MFRFADISLSASGDEDSLGSVETLKMKNDTFPCLLNNVSAQKQDLKLIKVRVLCPNRSKRIIDQHNIVNDIAKHPSESCQYYSGISSDFSLSFPGSEDVEIQRIMYESTPNRPIMGKNALLAKINALRNSEEDYDVKIIKELVEERFNESLNYFRQRSLRRRQAHKIVHDAEDEIKNDDDSGVRTDISNLVTLQTEEEYPTLQDTVDNVMTDESDFQKSANDTEDVKDIFDSQEFLKEALGDDFSSTPEISKFLVSVHFVSISYGI